MTRKCFLIEHYEPGAEVIRVADDVAHHIRKVLRLRPGDSIELRDGQGNGWNAIIREIQRKAVLVTLVGKQTVQKESPLRLTLALALSRSDRMELVLRQATEMGVHRFVAFRAERSDYSLPGSQIDKRKERWRKIACEALCQCGRTRLPEILILPDTTDLIAGISALVNEGERGLKILAKEQAERQGLLSLFRAHSRCREIMMVIGPEGGWSEREGDQFVAAEFYPVHLGPRTLRLETAAVAVLAAVQLLWGDLGDPLPGLHQVRCPL